MTEHGRNALNAHCESLMEDMMDKMSVRLDEHMGLLASTWEQRMVDTVLDTQKEHMEEVMTNVLQTACELSGATFGWKEQQGDAPGGSEGDGGGNAPQQGEGKGRDGSSPAEGEGKELGQTRVQPAAAGFQMSAVEVPRKGSEGLEDGEIDQGKDLEQTRRVASPFADVNMYASLDEESNGNSSSNSRSRSRETAGGERPGDSVVATKGPDGQPTTTQLVNPDAAQASEPMSIAELDISQPQPRLGEAALSTAQNGDFR